MASSSSSSSSSSTGRSPYAQAPTPGRAMDAGRSIRQATELNMPVTTPSGSDPVFVAQIRDFLNLFAFKGELPGELRERTPNDVVETMAIALRQIGYKYNFGVMDSHDVQWRPVGGDSPMPVTFGRPTISSSRPVVHPYPTKDLWPSSQAANKNYSAYDFTTPPHVPVIGHRGYLLKCYLFVNGCMRLINNRFKTDRRASEVWTEVLQRFPLVAHLVPTMQIKLNNDFPQKFVMDFDNVPEAMAPSIIAELRQPGALGPIPIEMTFFRRKSDELLGLHVWTSVHMSRAQRDKIYDRVCAHFNQFAPDLPKPDGQIYASGKLRAPGCFGFGKELPRFSEFGLHSEWHMTMPYFCSENTFSDEIIEEMLKFRATCQKASCGSCSRQFWKANLCPSCLAQMWATLISYYYPVKPSEDLIKQDSALISSVLRPVIEHDPIVFPIEFPRRRRHSPYSWARTRPHEDHIIPYQSIWRQFQNNFLTFLDPQNQTESIYYKWQKLLDFAESLQCFVACAGEVVHGWTKIQCLDTGLQKYVVKDIGTFAQIKINPTALAVTLSDPEVWEFYGAVNRTEFGQLFNMKYTRGKKNTPGTLKISMKLDQTVKGVINMLFIDPCWIPFSPVLEPDSNADINNTYLPARTLDEQKEFQAELKSSPSEYPKNLEELRGLFKLMYNLHLSYEDDHETKQRTLLCFWLDLAYAVARPRVEKPPHIPMLIGAQGSCKSLLSLWITKLMGSDHTKFPQTSDANNAHGSAYTSDSLMVIYDEGGDANTGGKGSLFYNALKRATNKIERVNPKYRQAVTKMIYSSTLFIANTDLTGLGNLMTPEERRFLVMMGNRTASQSEIDVMLDAIRGNSALFFEFLATRPLDDPTIQDLLEESDEKDEMCANAILTAIAYQTRKIAEGDEKIIRKEVASQRSKPAPINKGKYRFLLGSCNAFDTFVLDFMLSKGINTSAALSAMPIWVLKNEKLWETPCWCRAIPINILRLIFSAFKEQNNSARSVIVNWENLLGPMMSKDCPRYPIEEYDRMVDENIVPVGSFIIEEKNGNSLAYIGNLADARSNFAAHVGWHDFKWPKPITFDGMSLTKSPTLMKKANLEVRRGASNYGVDGPYVPGDFSEDPSPQMMRHLSVEGASALIFATESSGGTVHRLKELLEPGFMLERQNAITGNSLYYLQEVATKQVKQWEVRLKRARSESQDPDDYDPLPDDGTPELLPSPIASSCSTLSAWDRIINSNNNRMQRRRTGTEDDPIPCQAIEGSSTDLN